MSYVDRVLHPEERIVAMGRKHWIIYVRGAATLVLGIAIGITGIAAGGDLQPWIGWTGLLVGAIGLMMIAGAWIQQWTTEIAVTNRRVIQKTGLIRRHTSEMNMDKVESVLVNQPLLGRIFDYGSVVVRGTGAGMEGLHFIGRPLQLRSAIVVPEANPAAAPKPAAST
jgi:uncharacterized membrane protein YdbT with pleckstrin-like domain